MTDSEKQEGEIDQSLTEHSRLGFMIHPFKVLIFPFRAFKEIARSHSLMSLVPGVVLVMALNAVVLTSTAYMKDSRIFLDSGTQSSGLLGADFVEAYLAPVLLQSLLGLILSWVVYAAVLFLIARLVGKKSVELNIFLMVVGYAFSVLVIYGAMTAVLYSLLPEIHFEANIWQSGTAEEVNSVYEAVWGSMLAYRLMDYLGFIFVFWLAFLGAIVVRVYQEISLMMAIAVSLTAYFASTMLIAFVSLLM